MHGHGKRVIPRSQAKNLGVSEQLRRCAEILHCVQDDTRLAVRRKRTQPGEKRTRTVPSPSSSTDSGSLSSGDQSSASTTRITVPPAIAVSGPPSGATPRAKRHAQAAGSEVIIVQSAAAGTGAWLIPEEG